MDRALAVALRSVVGAAFAAIVCTSPRATAQGVPGVGTPTGRDEYLTPKPDKVPVVVESEGAPLTVGVQTGGGSFYGFGLANGRVGFVGGQSEIHSVLCQTPCTLYARPGYLPLWTGGGSRRALISELYVPTEGMWLRMHAPSIAGFVSGVGLVGVGAGLLVTAAVVLPLATDADTGQPCYEPTTCRDGTLVFGGVGLAMVVGGAWLLIANRSGVATARALRSGAPLLTVSGAPMQGGAVVAGAIRF
jgi:hypothetical protein